MTERRTIEVSDIELWIIRIAGACMIGVLGWIGVQFQQAIIHIAEIRKELEIVKPADILSAVQHLEKSSLSQSEIEAIVIKSAPWTAVAQEWRDWRKSAEQRVYRLEERTITKEELRTWLRTLKATNPELDIPDL